MVTAPSRTERKKSPHAPRGGDVSYPTLGPVPESSERGRSVTHGPPFPPAVLIAYGTDRGDSAGSAPRAALPDS
ncbi:hypothetical protein ACE1SV_40850 [Streptomyces sennicomposti]